MPVYRPDPRYFADAVDSVLSQTLTDFEFIIVEDPSDQTGAAVIESRRDPRIRYIANPARTSLPKQHNRAVSEARAEFIARFDADDVCEPERLEKQVAFLREHPEVDIVASQLRIIDEESNVVAERRFPLDHESIRKVFPRGNPLAGSNVMFRRKVVETIGGWRETTDLPGQDYEWYSRAAVRGFRFAAHPDALVRYRIHRSQIKRTRTRGTILTDLEVKKLYWSKELGLRERFIMFLARIALLLPPRLVLLGVRLLFYRKAAR